VSAYSSVSTAGGALVPRVNAALVAKVRRHSRHVRVLRVAVPLFVVLGIGAIAGLTFFNPLRALTGLNIDPGKLALSGTKITMQGPRMQGFTSDGRPYEFNASAAAQDIGKPDILELKDIHARMELPNQGSVEMSALAGLYDTKADLLRINDNIVLKSTTGYDGVLTEAVIEIKKGRVVSDQPVEVKMLNGTLKANRMEITNSGELARFDGGVVVDMMLDGTQVPAEARR
jgi:lipopolysaccharide export system protein LptC